MAEPYESADRSDPAATSSPEEVVRIHIALGDVAITFEGRRAFYDVQIEPLVRAAYARSASSEVAAEAAAVLQAEADPAGESVAAQSGAPNALPSAAPGLPVFTPSAPQRFQQFAGQVGANAVTAEQRVMVFAFYLWNYERQDDFTEEDILAFFRTVHEDPPDDLGRMLTSLRDGKRFLEDGAQPESWRLATKGVNYVKNRLLGGD